MLSERLFGAELHPVTCWEIAEWKGQEVSVSSVPYHVSADKAVLSVGPCAWACEPQSGLREARRTSPVLVKGEGKRQPLGGSQR